MTNAEEREALARVWRQSARLTRADIFGRDDPLRPVYSTPAGREQEVDVCATGAVGTFYRQGSGIAFVSVNPAGGKDTDGSTTASDIELYRAFRGLRDATDDGCLAAFERVNERFAAGVVNWRITRQHLNPILESVNAGWGDVAYVYLVPFRTRGDAGSKLPDPYQQAGYDRHLRAQLDALDPRLIITVDGPSRDFSQRWAEGRTPRPSVEYITRKRDAHAERRRRWAELRALYNHGQMR